MKKSYLHLLCQLLNEDGTTIPDYTDLDEETLLQEMGIPMMSQDLIDKKEDNPIDVKANVSCANNLLHSLFSQIDLSLNDRLITNTTALYPYSAYIQTILCNNKTNSKIKDEAALFIKDDGGQMDDSNLRGWNTGLYKRGQFMRKSRVFDLCGALFLDISNANRHILNGVNVKLSLYRSKNNFYIIRPRVTKNSAGVLVANPERFMIRIISATMYMCKITPNNAMYLAHDRLLREKKQLARYSYYRSECRKCQIGPGSFSFDQSDIFQGNVPIKVYLGLTWAANSAGDMSLNPFQFIPANLTSLTCSVDGKVVEGSMLNMNYGDTMQESNFVQAYYSLFKNDENVEKNCQISREEFFNGYNIYAVQISSDVRTESGDVFPISNKGNFSVNLTFGQATPDPLTLIVLAYFPATVKIDYARNIIVDGK